MCNKLFTLPPLRANAASGSAALPTPAEWARRSGAPPSRPAAAPPELRLRLRRREWVPKTPLCVQARRRICVFLGRAQGSDAPCRGIWTALHGKLGGSSGAVISGGTSLGARGRRSPAEEVVRELPGAGSRERLGGSCSLSREIETACLVVEVESSTLGNGGGEQPVPGGGGGAVFSGLSVSVVWEGAGGVALAGKAPAVYARGPPSRAWGSPICPHETSLLSSRSSLGLRPLVGAP